MADLRLVVVVTVLSSNGEGRPRDLFRLIRDVLFFCGDFLVHFITWQRLIKNLAPCEEKSAGLTGVMCQELLQRREGPGCAPSHI
jgi:hypothetical protein